MIIFVLEQFNHFYCTGPGCSKAENINPGLNVNWGSMFSCLKMFFTSNVWCSLRLLQLKTEGKQDKQNTSPKNSKIKIKILANPELA